MVFISIGIILCTYTILRYLFPQKYSKYVQYYANVYSIDENLVYAIIKCESNFKADSISHAGAIGLMQITPETLEWAALKSGDKEITKNDLFTDFKNIKYGCYIFSLFSEEFGSVKEALACYNAGRGNVLRWLADKKYSDDGILLKDIPFEETKKYIKKVTATKRIYDLLY